MENTEKVREAIERVFEELSKLSAEKLYAIIKEGKNESICN